jgi:tetratricopeptide (TPR) repeat protein
METSSELNDLGIALTQAGNFFEAVTVFRKAVLIDKGNPLLYLNMGLAGQKAGDYAAAAKNFRKALELQSGLYDAWAALGLVYYEMGRLESAEDCYKKALTGEKKSETLNNLGVLYYNQEKYEDARYFFEEAAGLSPFYYDALYNLRDTCRELKDFRAEEEVNRLLSKRKSL